MDVIDARACTMVDACCGHGIIASRDLVCGPSTAQKVSVPLALVISKFN